MFVTELTDKDAFLLLALSTKVRARTAFLAGAAAFTFTSAVIVTFGSLLLTVVPVYWVRDAGGIVMIAFAVWEARGLVGLKVVREEESRIRRADTPRKAFLAMVAALALLDLAGDATEILIIVFLARFGDALLVFAAACVGLIAATALETTLGSRLRSVFTPRRLQVGSSVVFLVLGMAIILLNSP